MNSKRFDPATTALTPGINLLEASAGTGKTFAIAMLATRFIVEQGMDIEQLLVVTFTRAATEELKARIRARLQAVATGLQTSTTGSAETLDSTLQHWLQQLDIAPEIALQRIRKALLDIDQAGIFTIHGFCQRILAEHALESGQLFDSELLSDISDLRLACADDFWRREIYARNVRQAALLTAVYATPEQLLHSVGELAKIETIYPQTLQLEPLLQQCLQQITAAAAIIDDLITGVASHFPEQTFKKSYITEFEEHTAMLSHWLKAQTECFPAAQAFALLTRDGLKDGLNGNKFRSNKSGDSNTRKQTYLDSLGIDTAALDALQHSLNQLTLALRRSLIDELKEALEQRLLQLNVLSFDKLISRLSDALESDQRHLLSTEIQQRYQVTLIDEFQDTDPQQWSIFSTLFATQQHYLYLIGDPKQAIYKFRGADIFAYFKAQQQAQQHYTLDKNWRSHPGLVSAVNTLFSQRSEVFFFRELTFQPVLAAMTTAQGELRQQQQPVPPMVLWQLQQNDNNHGYWSSGEAGDSIMQAVVNEILHLLNSHYELQQIGADAKLQTQKLQPQNIAILVRTNAQAQAYQDILREVGVPAVLSNQQSVFASGEAEDLFILLQAIAQPGNRVLLIQALSLDWFGLDGQQLYRAINEEQALDDWVLRLQDYYLLWQQQGLMVMMHALLEQEQVSINLARYRTAERQLTNLHHLLELLQQEASERHLGIAKTLDWLHTAMTEVRQDEAQQLRLESDAHAVTIMTMHRAKGLEFPLVFCPYAWQHRQQLATDLTICHENQQLVADLGSEQFAQRQQQAAYEQLAEDMRVLYVALTRAKFRCYLIWADVRTAKQANRSALSRLLFDTPQSEVELDFSQQQQHLQQLAQAHTEAFSYVAIDAQQRIVSHYHRTDVKQTLKHRPYSRKLNTSWQMSSYTALSALNQHETPELPHDKAQEQKEDSTALELALPKGAQTGNVVHELLELNNFHDLAQLPGKRPANYIAQRDSLCQRYGLNIQQPQLLDELLQQTVSTPLSVKEPAFRLADLEPCSCLKEMPFYLSSTHMNTVDINRILQQAGSFQPLNSKQIAGFLTGFIDLVCEHNKRYYLLDYKTNTLPDYQPESMLHAMREHNYGLQYWLYTLVLHHYLQQRLPEYDYQRDFGGVYYLFVRGMRPEKPGSGVFYDRPDADTLKSLATLFATGS